MKVTHSRPRRLTLSTLYPFYSSSSVAPYCPSSSSFLVGRSSYREDVNHTRENYHTTYSSYFCKNIPQKFQRTNPTTHFNSRMFVDYYLPFRFGGPCVQFEALQRQFSTATEEGSVPTTRSLSPAERAQTEKVPLGTGM